MYNFPKNEYKIYIKYINYNGVNNIRKIIFLLIFLGKIQEFI